MASFETKDSGAREQYDSGMVRDTASDKTNYSLVYDGPMLTRWGGLLTRGAVKYEKRNWMKANSEAELERFLESAARHFAQWIRGDRDEDHAAAVFFNINGAEFVRERIEGELTARGANIAPPEPGHTVQILNKGLSNKEIGKHVNTDKTAMEFVHGPYVDGPSLQELSGSPG